MLTETIESFFENIFASSMSVHNLKIHKLVCRDLKFTIVFFFFLFPKANLMIIKIVDIILYACELGCMGSTKQSDWLSS